MRRALYLAGILSLLTVAAVCAGHAQGRHHPAAPVGITAIALDGEVGARLAAGPGRDLLRGVPRHHARRREHARDARGPEPDALHRRVRRQRHHLLLRGPRASDARRQSGQSERAQATPRARIVHVRATRSCTRTASRARRAGRPRTARRAYDDGIEGFASASSVNAGGSVDLRVASPPGRAVPRRDLPHRPLRRQPGPADLGAARASPASSSRLPPASRRPPAWSTAPTGRVDDDRHHDAPTGPRASTCSSSCARTTGTTNEILLVVRDDGSTSDVLVPRPDDTYQAYNNYDGKSLYDGQSDPPNTVAARTARREGVVRPAVRAAHA